MADNLIAKYRCNSLTTIVDEETKRGKTTKLGYPAWWLKSVGYEKGRGDYTK